MIGMSQPHVHNVLKGERNLSIGISDSILNIFHISILDLASLEDLDTNLKSRRPWSLFSKSQSLFSKYQSLFSKYQSWTGPSAPAFPGQRRSIRPSAFEPRSRPERVCPGW